MLKRYFFIILTYTIAQLSAYPIAVYISASGMEGEQALHTLIYWQIFSFIVALVVTALLLKPEKEMPRHPEAASKLMIVIWSLLGIFLAMFGQIIANVIQQLLFQVEPQSENTMQIMEIARTLPVFIIVVTVIGPILEEVIFRKIIFGELYKRTNFVIAGVISGVLFAVIHMDFTHLLVYFVMSFVFAFVYVQSKRIIVPILAHVGMNTLVVLIQLSIDPAELEQIMEQYGFIQLLSIGG
ncbi:membrane protease YdiL (CAAX protease family) [Natronobacillus azotifigens]|uniref:Type II CAAX endopeptidase family protein n=1 Tax=Natronobacillus azotifigens TaxID=472978 RepID=A0A9J6RG99_9BACI|nr:type II CAAX endopeptidase family protein [Natronobacillus azotifigens]MCZ0704185.1 type II CAAX endopeptidase family protein [Natronobacillus azotifigens]